MKYLTIVVLQLFSIVALAAVSPPYQAQPFGKIETIRGSVERRVITGSEMKIEPMQITSDVMTQQVIATEIDGIVTINTLSGDEVTLFPSSRLILKSAYNGRYQLKLVHGKLKIKTRENFKIGNGDRIEIQTFNLSLGATGPSEFTIYRDLIERCKPENSPKCPSSEYYNQTSNLLKENKLFSSIFVSKAESPLYVGQLNKQEWDSEKFSKLTNKRAYDSIGEREWIIASGNVLRKSDRAKIVP